MEEHPVAGPEDFAADIRYLVACLVDLDSSLGASGPFSGPVPVSAFIRMDLSLALLVAETDADLAGALASLREILQQIHHTLSSVPERCDPALNPVWEHCADYLEGILVRRNEGATLPALAADAGWREMSGRLTRAGGPLGVMDGLADVMGGWDARWSRQRLEPGRERELAARWRQLRSYGDRLFQKGLLDAFEPGTGKKDQG